MAEFLTGARVLVDSAFRDNLGVVVADGRIAALSASAPAGAAICPLPAGSYLTPGLIDLQVNGGGGVLFNDAPTEAGARAIAAAHRTLGTAAVLPTLITDTAEKMTAAAAAVRAAVRDGDSGVAGVHFEGPFLSPARPGIHDRALIRGPDPETVRLIADLAREIPVLVTVAPECVADETLGLWAEAGVVLSAGHSETSLARVQECTPVAAVTHVWNAMPAPAGRAPGLVGAALALDGLYAAVIADGVHVSPEMLRVTVRSKPPGRLLLVSDSMSVAGTGLTGFTLAGKRIARAGGRLVDENGTLAGADLSLAAAVANIVRWTGLTLETAVAAASTNPARLMSFRDRGTIAPGMRADFCLFGPALNPLGCAVGGQWADTASPAADGSTRHGS